MSQGIHGVFLCRGLGSHWDRTGLDPAPFLDGQKDGQTDPCSPHSGRSLRGHPFSIPVKSRGFGLSFPGVFALYWSWKGVRSPQEPFPAHPSAILSQPDPVPCPIPSQFSGKSPSRRIWGGGKGPSQPCPTQNGRERSGKNSGMGFFGISGETGNGARGLEDVRDPGKRSGNARIPEAPEGHPRTAAPPMTRQRFRPNSPAKIPAKFPFGSIRVLPGSPGAVVAPPGNSGHPVPAASRFFWRNFQGIKFIPWHSGLLRVTHRVFWECCHLPVTSQGS